MSILTLFSEGSGNQGAGIFQSSKNMQIYTHNYAKGEAKMSFWVYCKMKNMSLYNHNYAKGKTENVVLGILLDEEYANLKS